MIYEKPALSQAIMAWKDYLYFTRAERIGIKVLAALIVCVIFVPIALDKFGRKKTYDFTRFKQSVREFEQSLERMQASDTTGDSGSNDGNGSGGEEIALLTPFPFNPNELPESEWVKTGLPTYVIRVIKNYENAGGRFRYREDLQRIYVMEEEWYRQLEPFIELPRRPAGTAERHRKTSAIVSKSATGIEDSEIATGDRRVRYDSEPLAIAEKESAFPLVIELNSADTLELMRIRGIGQVFSRRIVGYRELLGGYISKDQLLEVYGLDSVRWQQIIPHIEIDTAGIRKMHLGQADFINLLRHPYIDRNLANAMINYRDQHGTPDSLAQIKEIVLVTEEVFERIAPYLETDPR